MQTAEHILQAMRKMGEKRIPLKRVYRCLFSEDLFLTAYDKIARNKGAMTAGSDERRYRGWNEPGTHSEDHRGTTKRTVPIRPARRIQVPKKSGGTTTARNPELHG